MVEELGELTVPTGTLRLFDCGALVFVAQGRIPEVPAVRVAGLPRGQKLRLVGQRVASGSCAGQWDWWRVLISDAQVARAEPAGEVIVDFARILFADDSVDAHWRHDESLDGRADLVFWGRDAAELARSLAAQQGPDEGTWGWFDAPVESIPDLSQRLETACAERGARVATDYRPHSHHSLALAAARASPRGAASLDAGPLRVCLAFTGWGDGLYPVFIERDAAGELASLRVQLYVPEDETPALP
jgi:hypothetical protein